MTKSLNDNCQFNKKKSGNNYQITEITFIPAHAEYFGYSNAQNNFQIYNLGQRV